MTAYKMRRGVGRKIRELRKGVAGGEPMSQMELAVKLGLSHPGVVSQWETGKLAPTSDELAALAECFGVEQAELLIDAGSAEAQQLTKASRVIYVTLPSLSVAAIRVPQPLSAEDFAFMTTALAAYGQSLVDSNAVAVATERAQ